MLIKKVKIDVGEIVPRPYGYLINHAPKEKGVRHFSLSYINLDPGKCTSKHFHPQDEVWFIISGEGIVQSKDQTTAISSSDLVFIPGGEIHQLTNSGPSQLGYLAVLAPPRQKKDVVYLE